VCVWVGGKCWIMRGAAAMCNTECSDDDNAARFLQHWRWLKYYSTNFVLRFLFHFIIFCVIITIFISRAFSTATVSFFFCLLHRSLCPQLRTHMHTHTLALSVSATAFLKRFCFRPQIPLLGDCCSCFPMDFPISLRSFRTYFSIGNILSF